MARQGLDALSAALATGLYDVVIADEVNVAYGCRLISEADCLALLDARPPSVELVLTGRKAPPAVIAKADLVTEIKPVKHYFEKGVLARIGIES
jgi:cob(I)alamin adenosyltransferase